jgi:hypothetical protein
MSPMLNLHFSLNIQLSTVQLSVQLATVNTTNVFTERPTSNPLSSLSPNPPPSSLSPNPPPLSLSTNPPLSSLSTNPLLSLSTLSRAFISMALSPEATYNTLLVLENSAQAFVRTRSYAFTKKHSKKSSSSWTKVVINCDRHDSGYKIDSNDQRQRYTDTCSTSCQFSIIVHKSLDKQYWNLKHCLDPKFSIYNHRPSMHSSAHYAYQRLDQQQQQVVEGLVQAGILLFHLFTTLYNCFQLSTNMYNPLQPFATLWNPL